MTSLTIESDPAAGPPRPSGTPSVEASFAYCHAVTRAQAKNFYYGMRLTPGPKRSALYAVYAFMRACDDLVDQPVDDAGNANGHAGDPSPVDIAAARGRVEAFRADLDRVLDGQPLPAGDMWPAFAHVVETYPVQRKHLHAMLDGQLADLERTAYPTFEALYDYCFKVASVVGLVCVSVWGHDGDASVETLSEHRGIALQLTNILRDVVEDARRGRVYLPGEDLDRFGVDLSPLAAGGSLDAEATARFRELMAFEVVRAQSYYRRSASLESHLDPACRATCWAMMRIYRRILEKIAARPTRVLHQRVKLSPKRKSYLAARATWKRTWGT